MPGVEVVGDEVVFEGYSDKHIDLIRDRVQAGDSKSFLADFRKEYSPSEIEQTLIKDKVGDRIKDFHFVETIAADTIIDRAYDKFTKAFLERMANKYIEGRTIVDSHNTKVRIGRTFAAEVIPHPEQPNEYQLIVKFYLSPNTPDGEKAINEVKDGIVDRVSVSFRPDYEAVTFYDEDDEKNPHPGKVFWQIDAGNSDLEEVIELSLVAMGAQPGARFKSENGRIEDSPTFDVNEIISTMETKEIKLTIGGVEKTFKVETSKVGEFETLAKQIGDLESEQKTLKTENEDLKKSLKSYTEKEEEIKDELVSKLINLKTTIYGEDAIDAEAQTEIAKALPLTFIEKEIELLTETAKNRKSLKPDPKKEEDKDKSESTGTWMDNA